jgi:uncharacterized protein (DUF2267 family)
MEQNMKSKAEVRSHHIAVFARTMQKSHEWVLAMQKDIGYLNADEVYHILRAVLQTLRDQLSVNEAAQFAAQLPLLLRGAFYECWDPNVSALRGCTKEEFLIAVQHKMGFRSPPNFNIAAGVTSALRVIQSHVSSGEMKDIISQMRPSLKRFVLQAS